MVGIGYDLLGVFYAKMNSGVQNFEELGVMLVFCVALLMLVNRVPPLVAGVISGASIGGTGGIGNFGAGAVVGAAMSTAGVAAGAARMAGTAVAEAAGGTQALMAAVRAGQENVSAGTGSSTTADGTNPFDFSMPDSNSRSWPDSSTYSEAAGFNQPGSGSSPRDGNDLAEKS